MNCCHEDLQRALRISNAIQEYFRINYNYQEVRSTDLYEFLAKRNLIERDRHQGFHFRSFLQKLNKNGYLGVIPQCSYTVGSTGGEWRFTRMTDEKLSEIRNKSKAYPAKVVHKPKLPEVEIDRLIDLARKAVENLPKRDTCDLTQQQIEIRKNYQRAYEEWLPREIEIMSRAYIKFERVDKVAELLQRQPHIVEDKLREARLL
ncbi:hypothetical protein SAMN05444266_10996 [Chitinophaga jiangningensis]|uniref:Uncharacterized protein n=1 Tax=Chitinophaga jiangningensis TaxID=1419482 RepID=A0A1M7K0J1_9BACT|nr:hypothetical protein [Chitinophaga jiangningensis]SHM58734.1 hypothetical protein SAMN05444266_10996 [Chitinophaga jiangningensis]